MKKKYRFFMLFFMCIFTFGACFCYDYPACLQIQIEEEFNIKHKTYGLLYTVYAIPNLILPLFGGLLFDYIGARNGLMIYTAIVALGQCIIMIGGYKMSFDLILLGRIVFGIGAESIYVGQSAIASEWFLHYETSMALALCTCFPQMASFVAGIVIP